MGGGSALNATTDGTLATQIASGGQIPSDSSLLRSVLFEPIPVDEIGPYESN